MLTVDLNGENHSILVQHNSTTVAEGRFVFDRPDRTILVILTQVTISPDDKQQLDELLFRITSCLDQRYNATVLLRLPLAFDNRIDTNNLEFKNQISRCMAVNMSDLKCDNDDLIQYNREQYALITDKQIILNYSQQLVKMLNTEAYWAKQWDEQEIRNRINSASNVAIILDRTSDFPCGFARLITVRTNNAKGEEETFGFLTDIVTSVAHQTKGLGRAMVNTLVGAYIGQDSKQRRANGSLCLLCSDEGIGAISAPKLNRRYGFEYLTEIGNRIAIFDKISVSN